MSASFEDLEVWKRSCKLAVTLYAYLKECREYWLRDQMLRAAISIPSNIAEGCERNGRAEFRHFLGIAKGSAGELRTQLYIAQRIGLIANADSTELIRELKQISRMLHGLLASLRTGNFQPSTLNQRTETLDAR